ADRIFGTYITSPSHYGTNDHESLVRTRSRRLRSRRSQPLAKGVGDGLRTITDLSLGEQIVDMGLHGCLRDVKLPRDLRVGPALRDQPEHLDLPPCQPVRPPPPIL